jgi:hypothetical protein
MVLAPALVIAGFAGACFEGNSRAEPSPRRLGAVTIPPTLAVHVDQPDSQLSVSKIAVHLLCLDSADGGDGRDTFEGSV